jgi:hypothetical protein
VTLVRFHAKRVGLDESFGCTIVTLDSTRREYLTFQRADPPEPDEAGGPGPPDEEVYLERCGQGWAARGGVVACLLGRDRLRLQVSEATAARLGGAAEFEITFKVGAARYARLRELLRKVFRGEASYQESNP